MKILSTVRKNLLTRPNYTPYCGSDLCHHRMPRTRFNGEQFECRCGWVSQYDEEFIEEYKRFRNENKSCE